METMQLRNLLITTGLLLVTNVASAEVLLSHRIIYYDIYGSTHQQLKQEMVSKGNIRADYISSANTEVSYNSKVTKSRQGSSCKVEHIKILVDVVQTYPKWINMYRGSQSLIDEWNQFMAASVTHEDRHMSEGLEVASKLDQHLQSFNWSSDCRTIDKQLNEESHKILDDYKNNGSLVYDRETNHGLNNGTRW